MARRVVAKVEFHCGELFPRVGFIVSNLGTSSRAVNTGVKVHQRIALKIHHPEEDVSGVWPLAGGARGGITPSPCH